MILRIMLCRSEEGEVILSTVPTIEHSSCHIRPQTEEN